MKKIILSILLSLTSIICFQLTTVNAEEIRLTLVNYKGINVDAMVYAIWCAEGKNKAQYLYGIRSVKYSTPEEARRICRNSVVNNIKRWEAAGKPKPFIEFMGDRYSPPTAHKFNKNWVRLVTFFYNKY